MELSYFSIFSVIICGMFYASADFTRKKASQFCSPIIMTAIVFTSVIPIYLTIFINANSYQFSSVYVLPGLGTVIMNVTANLFFIRSVSVSPLSKTIPLLSLTPVFSAIVSWLFLKENLLTTQWLGIILVVIGILWLYVPKGDSFNFKAIFKNFLEEKGAKYMCITALCWTLSPIFDRVALRYTTVPTHALIHFCLASLLLWGFIFLNGGLKKYPLPKKEGWKIIAILSLSYAGAMGMQMLSLKMLYVGIVEAVKRVIGQISSLILGRIFFKEEITQNKIFGIVAMAIGVPLIIIA